jgi:hypothetical protein
MILEWMKQEKLRKYKRELLTLLKVEGKVEVVIMKIDLWSERLQDSVSESFPTLFLATFCQEIRNLITQEFLNRRAFRDCFLHRDDSNTRIAYVSI